MKIYIPMTADLFHVGHLNLLKKASKLGDVYVGLITDNICAKYKRKPIIPYQERREILLALPYVKKVIRQESLSPLRYMRNHNMDTIISGDDDFLPDEEIAMNMYHGAVINSGRDQSTTNIIKTICSRNSSKN